MRHPGRSSDENTMRTLKFSFSFTQKRTLTVLSRIKLARCFESCQRASKVNEVIEGGMNSALQNFIHTIMKEETRAAGAAAGWADIHFLSVNQQGTVINLKPAVHWMEGWDSGTVCKNDLFLKEWHFSSRGSGWQKRVAARWQLEGRGLEPCEVKACVRPKPGFCHWAQPGEG